jgi:hypothetical protein
LALCTHDLVEAYPVSKARRFVQTIAALSIDMVEMRLKFSILRKITDETVNKFVSQLSVAKKTSNRG